MPAAEGADQRGEALDQAIRVFRIFYPGTSAADQAGAQAIIDSIEITP